MGLVHPQRVGEASFVPSHLGTMDSIFREMTRRVPFLLLSLLVTLGCIVVAELLWVE